MASPWLLRLGHRVAHSSHLWPWEPIIGLSVVRFVAPPVLGLAVVAVRRASWFRNLTSRFTRLGSEVSSWDFAFTSRGPFFVRAKLRTGERVGGLFGASSFASAYPEPHDIFLEEAWILTDEGLFVEPVPGGRGLLMKQGDVELLEFIELGDE